MSLSCSPSLPSDCLRSVVRFRSGEEEDASDGLRALSFPRDLSGRPAVWIFSPLSAWITFNVDAHSLLIWTGTVTHAAAAAPPAERSAPSPMKYPPAADRASTRIELSERSGAAHPRPGAAVSLLTPQDPLRQAKRLPIRVIKMLTAHTGHLLHPDYLQPLTSAPVSIEVGHPLLLLY